MTTEQVNYRPPGKQAASFHKSNAFVRGLMGPVGSGKSSSCCMEIVYRALKQRPYATVRRSRWAVIRNTYPELKSTTIKTFQTWFPEGVATFKWDAPITATINIPNIGDGTRLELEVLFLALDKPSETGKLRSLELTGGWINECSEVPKEIFDMLTQRVGRYPAKTKGGPSWSGVILDTNPPDDDHWYYKLAEEDRPHNYEFFRQPGALYIDQSKEGLERYTPNPDGENIDNLPNGYNYYLNQLGGKAEDWVNIFILGNYGTTSDGKPVYPEFNDKIHVSPVDLEPIRGLPLILGWDFGLTPACVIMQQTPKGQVLILRELLSEGMGIRQFASDVVKPVLLNEFDGMSRISVADPAGQIRAQTDERTCLQELLECGIATEPANTNDWLPRRESVAYFLTRMIDGQPGFLLDPRCRNLRRGFNGRYRYERLRTSGSARFKDRPVKDDMSHIQDALQYACLKLRSGVTTAKARPVLAASNRGWV